MKPISMTNALKTEISKIVQRQLLKKLEEYSPENKSVTLEIPMSIPTKDKITILFTQEAYLKSKELVNIFPGEVGWYGLIRKLDHSKYEVYDILVCKQKVNGVRVITEDADMVEFFDSLTDDQANHMFFQAHSHVSMGTTPSTVDTDNQKNTVQNLNGKGFFLFQIWNKQGDINSFLYDLDENLLYGREDIEIVVETAEGSLKDFSEKAKSMVETITYTQGTWNNGTPYWKGNETNLPAKKEPDIKPLDKNPVDSIQNDYGFYWNDGMGQEGWD